MLAMADEGGRGGLDPSIFGGQPLRCVIIFMGITFFIFGHKIMANRKYFFLLRNTKKVIIRKMSTLKYSLTKKYIY